MKEPSTSRVDRRLSASKVVDDLVGSILGDTRQHVFESEMKAADYEAMMQRFQLRRLSSHTPPGRKLKGNRVVLDKYLEAAQPPRPRGPQRFSVDRLTRQLSRRVIQTAKSAKSVLVVLPWSRAATTHGLAMMCLYHFQIFYLPFAPVFFPSGSTTTTIVGVVLEMASIFNVAFNFNVAYVENKATITCRRRIARRYARSWLIVDLLSAVPVQIMWQLVGVGAKGSSSPIVLHDSVQMALRILRFSFGGRMLLRQALGSSDRLAAWINYSRYSHLLGIVRLLWLVVAIAHYMACFWHLLLDDNDHPSLEQSVAENYIANYLSAVTLIHGQGDVADHWACNLFSVSVVLVGSVMVATVFGNVAMLVSNFNANATTYQRKMEGVFATMDKMELPDRLRDRIQQYYTHVWAEYKSLDGDLVRFQRELTHTLGLEVGLFKYMGLVNDIPFWADCSPDFIAQIVTALVVRVYLPDDFVVRQGEVCSEMFMVNRGVCERTSKGAEGGDNGSTKPALGPPGNCVKKSIGSPPRHLRRHGLSTRSLFDATAKEVYSGRVYPTHEAASKPTTSTETLHPGQAFGEMSLLMNYSQPSNVRAASFVELCVLQRATFQNIIARHPQDRRRVLKSLIKGCIEEQQVPFPWQDLCRAAASQRPGVDGAPWLVTTPGEAAQLLVQQIDVDLPDESIKFGFQSLDNLEHSDRKQPPTARSSKRVALSHDYDGGGSNDAVIKMLKELAASVKQLRDDVRLLKERSAGVSAPVSVHTSEPLSQGATRPPPTADQVAQLSWSHRGSSRRLDSNVDGMSERTYQSTSRPDTSNAETQTSTYLSTVESGVMTDGRAIESPKLRALPGQRSRLRLFSYGSPPVREDAVTERSNSEVLSMSAARILGEPSSRTASATTLADQLWSRRGPDARHGR